MGGWGAHVRASEAEQRRAGGGRQAEQVNAKRREEQVGTDLAGPSRRAGERSQARAPAGALGSAGWSGRGFWPGAGRAIPGDRPAATTPSGPAPTPRRGG